MKSSNDSPNNKTPAILLDNQKTNEDGSVTVTYVINNFALELCAKEYEKEMEELTEEEIHTFVTRNISSALKGHNNWKTVNISNNVDI